MLNTSCISLAEWILEIISNSPDNKAPLSYYCCVHKVFLITKWFSSLFIKCRDRDWMSLFQWLKKNSLANKCSFALLHFRQYHRTLNFRFTHLLFYIYVRSAILMSLLQGFHRSHSLALNFSFFFIKSVESNEAIASTCVRNVSTDNFLHILI